MNQTTTKKPSNLPVYILLSVTAIILVVMTVSEMRSKPAAKSEEISESNNAPDFISLIKENKAIIDAEFKKETGIVYITVPDDGKPKYMMAKYYSRFAYINKAYAVKGIKVVDPNGKELGAYFL